MATKEEKYNAAVQQNQDRRASTVRQPEKSPDPAYGLVVPVSDTRCIELQTNGVWLVFARESENEKWQPIIEFSGTKEDAVSFANEMEV